VQPARVNQLTVMRLHCKCNNANRASVSTIRHNETRFHRDNHKAT